MEIKRERTGSTLLLRLFGTFGEVTPEFDDALTGVVHEGTADIIVDLSAVDDFRAMRSLITAERLRREQGGLCRLAIVAVAGSSTGERFMINGMRKTIPIFETVEGVHSAWETDGFPA